jgi:hypothetical protein
LRIIQRGLGAGKEAGHNIRNEFYLCRAHVNSCGKVDIHPIYIQVSVREEEE